MSTLRRAHRKAATELTTISKADKIVTKQERKKKCAAQSSGTLITRASGSEADGRFPFKWEKDIITEVEES